MKGKVLIFFLAFHHGEGVITRSAEMYDNLKTMMPGDFLNLSKENFPFIPLKKVILFSLIYVKMSRDANRHVLVHLTD